MTATSGLKFHQICFPLILVFPQIDLQFRWVHEKCWYKFVLKFCFVDPVEEHFLFLYVNLSFPSHQLSSKRNSFSKPCSGWNIFAFSTSRWISERNYFSRAVKKLSIPVICSVLIQSSACLFNVNKTWNKAVNKSKSKMWQRKS